MATALLAQSYTLQEGPGRTMVYEKAPERTDRSLIPGRTLYYIGGDRDRPIEARNRVVVSFKQAPDLGAFMAEFGLSNPRRVSRLYDSWRFDLAEGEDPVAVSAAMAKSRSDLRYAIPEWIAPDRRHK